MEPLLNIAVNAARQAGDIIIRYMDQIDRLKITEKTLHDYFSDVDVKAEQSIISTIHKAYPGHSIMAEESGNHEGEEEIVWIIDPLDGTSNYLHGFPFFCVSIAVKIKGRIEHGVIYDPLRHECFIASRGRGARLNNRRIRVSKQTLLSAALLGTGVPFRDLALAQRYLPSFQALMGKCAGVRRTGAAALDLAYVASGRLDGFWELGLKPWDIAAGTLLIREAGGMVSDTQGGDDFMKTGDVVAGNPKVFKSLVQTISAAM
ncbi:MAG: inositol monophosphatase family protein [Legionella sp.]|jgi:myo-inositol-1(or 4)-monophosphatase